MTNGPGDPAIRWNCPTGRGLCADLHSKDETVLKVAQRVQDSPRRSEKAPPRARNPEGIGPPSKAMVANSLIRFGVPDGI
jgi:hypothetical protein